MTITDVSDTTIRAFFENLAVGALIEHRHETDGTQYIWSGIYERVGGAKVGAKLIDSVTDRVFIARDFLADNDGSNDAGGWHVVTGSNVASSFVLNMIQHRLTADNVAEANLSLYEGIRRDLVALRADVKLLNQLMNRAAEEQGMCSTYDEFIENTNEELKVIELEGRTHDYEVEVDFTVKYTMTISVEGMKSADDAREFVENMNFEELMRETSCYETSYYDDYEVDITGVDKA